MVTHFTNLLSASELTCLTPLRTDWQLHTLISTQPNNKFYWCASDTPIWLRHTSSSDSSAACFGDSSCKLVALSFTPHGQGWFHCLRFHKLNMNLLWASWPWWECWPLAKGSRNSTIQKQIPSWGHATLPVNKLNESSITSRRIYH